MEKSILAAMFQQRRSYELFEQIGCADDFSTLARSVRNAISRYYELDRDVQCADKSLVEARMLGEISNPKHRQPLVDYLRAIPDDISAVNVEAEIRALHQRGVGNRLSQELANANGLANDAIRKLIREYDADGSGALSGNDRKWTLLDASDYSDLRKPEGLKREFMVVYPKALNDRLKGGAERGHHILVWARPDMGKTAFAVNLCAGFVHQGFNMLYIGNEEPVIITRDRFWARLLRTTLDAVQADPLAAEAKLAKRKIGKLRFNDEATTFTDVRSVLRQAKPDVLVLDQLRNMRVREDSKTAQLEAAATEARAIAKEFKILVVSITQAGDSASGKVYLDMSDVDNSKTGIPGAVDLMIGLGQDLAMRRNNMMGISLPKNKLGGNHDQFQVSVDFKTGVIE